MANVRITARRRRARTRRRRRLALVLVLVVVGVGAWVVLTLASSSSPRPPRTGRAAAASPAPPPRPAAIEAGLLPWQLRNPLSREIVLASPGGGQLVIAGGLDQARASASGIYRLSLKTGALALLGSLPQATHDAAGAALGTGLEAVIGGGGARPEGATQLFGGGRAARLAASLPQPRADAAATTIGATTYVVGGYSGHALDATVLATRTGTSYRRVARLAVPVRYPAVAAAGGRIYVFGGARLDGQAVDTVQVIDPASGSVRVLGQLPRPLSGAVAATLDGNVYIAGGTTADGRPSSAILAFEPRPPFFLRAGTLQVAVANAGAAVVGNRLWIVGGETAGGAPTAAVQALVPDRRFGTAGRPGAGSPFYGDRLLIADRGNDRLLVLDDSGRIVWTYPSRTRPAPPGGFYFPDDAFFIRHGQAIVSNQEDNDTIVEIAYPSGRLLFQYGHPHRAGSAPGYLASPDDAYVLANGDITAADSNNCRVVVLDPRSRGVVRQLGTPGRCNHDPPRQLGGPNGDTPLADGNLLVSEVKGSWIDELTLAGRLVWSTRLAIGYPSDPQQLGPDLYLVADYERPGGIVEFDRRGRILYRYQPSSGTGELDHPSLVERLPSGVFMLNDDYNHRMVAIDPATGALVWQYGHTGRPGVGYGMLDTPDGFDLLAPGGLTPTHLPAPG